MEAVHPIATHLPIALSLVVPTIMFIVLFFSMRGTWAPSTWFIPVLLAALVFGGAYYARDTGGQDAHHVVEVYGKEAVGPAIHDHATWSKYFYWGYSGVFVVSLLGLIMPSRKEFRMAAFFLSLGALVPLYYTGMLGGELVYEKGFASAFVKGIPSKQISALSSPEDE